MTESGPWFHVLSSEPRLNWFDSSIQVEANLHSPDRRLIELQIEHADLDAMIDLMAGQSPIDELLLRRLKKRRLALRDQIARLELSLDPKEPA